MYNIKFNIGNKVYPIIAVDEVKYVDCTICDKKGTISYRGKTLTCPECRGHKVLKHNSILWQLGKPATIEEIHIFKTKITCKLNEATYLSAPYYFYQKSFDINDCFKDLETACSTCDIRNHIKECK